MASLAPLHGGTDSGPEPLYDFSTNANPLGPCPFVLSKVREADLTRYPDPAYAGLKRTLAAYHDVSPRRIVVGAGASELILRLIRRTPGPVIALGPTFSEYRRCAQVGRRPFICVRTPAEFLRLQKDCAAIGFVCWPNNPTGATWPLEFVAEAAGNGPLAVDLAYAPLCAGGNLARIEAAARRAFRLYAPNKTYGLCGIRAGYVVTPTIGHSLDVLAPSWVIDRTAEAFLHTSVQPEALRWLDRTLPQIAAWRRALSDDLARTGLQVRESPATFLLARVGQATAVADKLRDLGLRVRDATSFGLHEWIRLGCQPPTAQAVLTRSLRAIVESLSPDLERRPDATCSCHGLAE